MRKHLLIIGLIFIYYECLSQKDDMDTAKQHDLNGVTVSGRYYRKYSSNTVSSALRIRTPLIALSQNIQSVNADMIRDQNVFNTTDALTRNVSGIVRQEVSNNLGPNIFMRGGQISSLRNGMDLTPLYRGPVPDDASVIEAVEFIKGPSMFMNNIGDPAGSFNVMTKQPTGGNQYSATAMFGSYDFYRLAVDLDGTFGKTKKFQYRFNVMGMKSNSFVKFDNNDRLLISPVLKYQIDDKTFVSAELIYQKFQYAMQSPILMTPNGFGTLPINFSIHEPSLVPYKPTDQNVFLTYNHQFSKDWSVTARASYLQNDSKGIYMWVTGVNAANPNILLRNPKYDLTRYIVYSQQAFVNGSFRTGKIKHSFLGGVDANQKKFYGDSYVEYNKDASSKLVYYPLDINNPVYGASVPDYSTPGGVKNGNTYQTTNYVSLYALDEMLFWQDKLRVTLGVRGTHLETYNSVSGTETNTSDFPFTPRAGLSYSFTRTFSAYALYDNTFQPQTGVRGEPTVVGTSTSYQANGAIQPLKGNIFEIGLKKDWAGGKWNTTVAVYTINRRNIAEGIPSTNYKQEIGKSNSKGVDVDIKGEVAKGLNIVINYAFNDSKITQDISAALVGARTPMYVKNIQNTWATYTLPGKTFRGLGLSLGYQYMGGRGERYATATQHDIPTYFRLDGGVNYHIKKFTFNLLLNNITNRNLIATPWMRSGLYYWVPNAPRVFRLSFNYSI